MYGPRKVYGVGPNVTTRSMSSRAAGQVMSLNGRNDQAGDEGSQPSESASDRLYGGYRGSLSQGESHGVFPSGLMSRVVDEESAAQEFKAEVRRKDHQPRDDSFLSRDQRSPPLVGDDISRLKIMARNMTPDDLEDVVKTLLKIKGERGGGADSAAGYMAHTERMEASNEKPSVKSRLDFGSADVPDVWTRDHGSMKATGNQTREKSSSEATKGFLGIWILISTQRNFLEILFLMGLV